jgi:hypothetical protein
MFYGGLLCPHSKKFKTMKLTRQLNAEFNIACSGEEILLLYT